MNYILAELPDIYHDFMIEPNIGIYVVKDTSMPIEAMFTRASIAAKSQTRNLFGVVSIFDDKMEQKLQDNQNVTQDMKKALEEEQFVVYLQPKYSLRTEKMIGSEALVRWFHPTQGCISPAKFIPVFESNGFIVELDHYMWEHVCMLLRRWKDEGRPVYPVSVNVSRISMYSQGTVPYLKNLVKKYEIDPKDLELELTESAYMDDPEDIKLHLKELQEFGFRILMDDFGSGYSSLNTLRELPVDILKLDMKFLTDSSKDLRGNIVLSSVVRMSKYLKLPIVAEGVETETQAAYLRSIGCEYVQGYLFAKPMPVEEYEAGLPQKAEVMVESEMDSSDNIYKYLTVPTNAMQDIAPIPVGYVEYSDGKFSFLRVNHQFSVELGLNKDYAPASQIFKRCLEPGSYETLIEAFETCAKTKQAVTFKLIWNTQNGTQKEYYTKVQFEGNIGKQTNLSIAMI